MPLTADEAFEQAAKVAERVLLEKARSPGVGSDPEKVHLAYEISKAIRNLKSELG